MKLTNSINSIFSKNSPIHSLLSYNQPYRSQMEPQSPSQNQPSNNLLLDPKVIAAIKIQKAWRNYHGSIKRKKRLKKIKTKTQIANELLLSQRTYCHDLLFIIKEVVKISKHVINDQQIHSIVFCNLETIYKMHQSFLTQLEQLMKKYNQHRTCLSSIIYNELFGKDDFKNNYSNYCANYRKANKMAKILFTSNTQFKNLLKQVGIETSNGLESYLIKPMQRLCKYELLLQNYFKNMQRYNLDYSDLQKTIVLVQKMVKETNEQVEQFLLRQKFKNDIQKQFQDVLSKIPNPNRKLIFTIEQISLIDLISDQSSCYKQLDLFNDTVLLTPTNQLKPIFCQLGFIRDLPNFKYFKNLVQLISSDRYLTISFKKQKNKQAFLQSSTKTNILNQNNDFVTVSVLGTQTRESLFKNYTVYILQIKFNKDNIKVIYPRFKNLLRVQEIVDHKKIQINLPSLNKQNYLRTTKSKTIEKRKLIIQQFLQKLLNCKQCYQSPQIFRLLDLTFKQKDSKNTQDQITISLPSSQSIKVFIDVKNSTISQLKSVVNHKLGLVYNEQFQIFQNRNKIRRLMHNDQLVYPIYQSQKGGFNPFKQNISYIYTRHHYLEPDEQFKFYKNDFVRTQLQLSVIKSQILKYRLEEQLMITFMCLFALYINLNVQDDSKLMAFIKDLCKKDYKISKQDFRAYYIQVQKKVQSQQDQLVTLPFLIIKIISNSPLYRCQQFEVTVHPKTYKTIKTYILALEQKIILGIKPTHLIFLTLEQKHTIQSYQMSSFEVKQVHPTAIVLQISNVGPAIKLHTQNAFQISKLIQIYKKKI